MDKIVIGKVLKAQGIKGELKILPITGDIARFKKLKKVFIGDNVQYEVTTSRIDTKFAYITLEGLNDRNAVEKLRDNYISVDRSDAVKLPEGSYFVVDLIGCSVAVDGKAIGVLSDVYDYTGGADTYEVKLNDGKILMFPALSSVLKNIDIENKLIELDSEKLGEVGVYED